jgi:hypothetical protein
VRTHVTALSIHLRLAAMREIARLKRDTRGVAELEEQAAAARAEHEWARCLYREHFATHRERGLNPVIRPMQAEPRV